MKTSREADQHADAPAASPGIPWAQTGESVAEALSVDPDKGLGPGDIPGRRRLHGKNTLREIKPQSAWAILANQFKNLIVLFLVTAAIVSLAFGELVEGMAITAVIFINAVIGFLTEMRGARSIEALRKLGTVASRVRRGGAIVEIPAEELLPGDIVILEGGDIITADLRLLRGSKIQADESVLTGESLPVSKRPEPVPEQAPLAERACVLFKGTSLTRGAGEAVVTAVGMKTELGRISSLVAETEEETTPLEKNLHRLGNRLIWVSLAIAALVAFSGIATGKDLFLMVETAIALAVASIPEGLPIVATIALARGVWRMAERNALVKELASVETLGATSVICTDKTGTLTENRLTVARLVLDDGDMDVKPAEKDNPFTRAGKPVAPAEDSLLHLALRTGALCNNASLGLNRSDGGAKPVGDPLEVALLEAALAAGIESEVLLDRMPEEREEAFDSTVKMMATFNRLEDGFQVSVKGAPESVLEGCAAISAGPGGEERPLGEDEKSKWLALNDRLAGEGLRVLALAAKKADSTRGNPYENLRFIGLVGLIDPPREDVREAIRQCREAGVRIVMATGDQPVTARAIGRAVGLVDTMDFEVVAGRDLKKAAVMSPEEKKRLAAVSLFARVSPEQKLDIIDIHRQGGAVVAMTGDGVNDAPALKKADIGIAMGLRGTQVAREASDMILKDDAFSTIVHAIEQGRIIFNNIRKFCVYLLSCNLSEIMTVTLGAVMNVPLPVLPLQILFLNIVTDVFPALALAAGESNPGIMERPPRDPREPIMARRHWLLTAGFGFVITVCVLGALLIALFWLDFDEGRAVTVSFLTLGFAQLWHVFNMRDPGTGIARNVIVRNPFVWGALALCTLLLAATVYLPGLSTVMKVAQPGVSGWLLIAGMSVLPLVLGQIYIALAPPKRPRQNKTGDPASWK